MLVYADEYSAQFKNTDINEFINTVSHNLHKTIIIDPSVNGNITVKSYELLNSEQYYQFFLSVLDVYGYAVIAMPNGVLKVIKSVNAKSAGVPVVDQSTIKGDDEVVSRVVQVSNISVRDLAPLLRDLIDPNDGGNVVHYEPSNVLLLTGRVAVVNRLVQIVKKVDIAGSKQIDIVRLKNASASEVVQTITSLNKSDNQGQGRIQPLLVADDRMNAVIVSCQPELRNETIQLIRKLDIPTDNQGSTKVFYLKFAQAKNLLSILSGKGYSQQENKGDQNLGGSLNNTFSNKDFNIIADDQTNSLVVTAQPNIMQEIEHIIDKLDIRRSQVLVEAIIVEMQDSDALNFGVQWVNNKNGATQFTATGLPSTSVATAAQEYKKNGTISTSTSSSLNSFNGIAAGFYSGDWGGLVTALSNNSKSNILATPSIVTLDNKEASFNVGQEVPVVTGSQSSTTGSVYSTVERKTVGTKLRVLPQINEGDSVLLNIEQEVSSVASTSATDSSSTSASLGATFNTRTIKNAVLVKSGETVVLGGLLNNQTSESVYKVPLLGDIPLLGYLFRYNSTSKSKQNLMVFIHPIVLRDQNSYSDVSAEKYDLYRHHAQTRLEQRDSLALPVDPEPHSDVLISPESKKSRVKKQL